MTALKLCAQSLVFKEDVFIITLSSSTVDNKTILIGFGFWDTVFPRIIAGGDYFFFRIKRGRLFEGGDYFKYC